MYSGQKRFFPLLFYYSLRTIILVPDQVTDALHYLTFTNIEPKCIVLEAPRDTKLYIEYVAPELRPPPGLQDSARRRLQAVGDGANDSSGEVNYEEKKKKIEETIEQMKEMGVGAEVIDKLNDELAQITTFKKRKQIEDAIKEMEEMGAGEATIATLRQELMKIGNNRNVASVPKNEEKVSEEKRVPESGGIEPKRLTRDEKLDLAKRADEAHEYLPYDERRAKIEEIKKRIAANEGAASDELLVKHVEATITQAKAHKRFHDHEEMMRKEAEEADQIRAEQQKNEKIWQIRMAVERERYERVMQNGLRPYMEIQDGLYDHVSTRPKTPGNIKRIELSYTGKETYDVNRSGYVRICFTFPTALPNKPMYLHFTIDDMEPPVDETVEIQDVMQRQIRNLEGDMMYLKRVADRILDSADQAKSTEMEFQNHSIKMNQSAYVWPMCQVFVLVLTGVLQARSISSVIKNRLF
eukprot:CAMPEP_0172483236 /NCGR_PEP_ID=MMETSP1066-20121228/10136_1 /TAXON_ID=671091 /ORGANISM="Coscinodiscus wailesii, Strain CCMP2513" /LENGTH=467 /DNA_ID=CAMNT_0013246975 /DNA_START=85 /DNA_END=1488 /DNA_ORIENTATION=+